MQEALTLSLFPSIETVSRVGSTSINPNVPNQLTPQTSIENALNSIFPKHSEEIKVVQVKGILGEVGKALSSEQVEIMVTEFEFLIDGWLDEYERETFKGMTLKEILNGG
ncbi:MAG TPA: hypothetical protein VMR59_04665 [Patescibacteria group bacterium]|jgi:hypothetical protein|nr:hypothetical protein [Patescibacteria group bacterium]